jgi:hypothetical protein
MPTWTEFVRFMMETSGDILWIRNIPAEFVKGDALLEYVISISFSRTTLPHENKYFE